MLLCQEKDKKYFNIIDAQKNHNFIWTSNQSQTGREIE